MDTPTPFDSDAPTGSKRAIVRYNPDDSAELEMVEATWGSNPRFSDGASYRFVRAEGKTFPSHRCLMPATEFHMTVKDRRYRVRLDDGNFFYLAGVWEPPMAGYPLAFRIITVAANAEVSRYQERHGAIILRRQVMQWLNKTVPETDLLETPPARIFLIDEITSGPRQPALGL